MHLIPSVLTYFTFVGVALWLIKNTTTGQIKFLMLPTYLQTADNASTYIIKLIKVLVRIPFLKMLDIKKNNVSFAISRLLFNFIKFHYLLFTNYTKIKILLQVKKYFNIILYIIKGSVVTYS